MSNTFDAFKVGDLELDNASHGSDDLKSRERRRRADRVNS